MIMFLFVHVYQLAIHSLTSCLEKVNFMGDIGVIHKPHLNLLAGPSPNTSTPLKHALVTDQPKSVSFVAVNRPRSSHSNQLKSSHVLTDFDDFLTVGTNIPGKCVMQDGLPIHVDVPSKSLSTRFLQTVSSAEFHSVGAGTAHRYGPTLDVMTASYCTCVVIGPRANKSYE